MPFFLPPDPSMGDAGSDYIPIDPRRRGRMPINPPNIAPLPPGGGVDPFDPRMPPPEALAGRPPSLIPYVPQPPNPTSQGLISALQGDTSWQNAPAPRPYVSPRDMMRQYGITDLTPPPAPQVNPAHGFWGKLGQHLLGAAEGMGSQRGLLPMLIGGIAGGVRPQLGANAWYNNVTTPRWQQQAGAQQGLANTRLNQIKDVGALTGINPLTGEQTFEAQKEENKTDAADALRALREETAAKHDKLERDLAEGRISQQQAALDSRMIIADMNNRMKDLEFTFRDRMATTAEEKTQIARERLAWEQQKAQEGSNTVTRDTFESIDPARDPANAAKIQQIYNEEGSKANQEHWKDKILNPTTGKMEPNPVYDPNYDAKGDPAVQRKIDKRIAAEIGKPTEKHTGTITEKTRGGAVAAPVGQGNAIPAKKEAKASELPAKLQDPRVIARFKQLGIPLNIGSLRKDLVTHGYTIKENE